MQVSAFHFLSGPVRMLVHASGAELLTDALQLPKCMHMSNRKATICDALAALLGNIFGQLR